MCLETVLLRGATVYDYIYVYCSPVMQSLPTPSVGALGYISERCQQWRRIALQPYSCKMEAIKKSG